MINKFEKSLRRYRFIIGGGFSLILLTLVTVTALLLTSYQKTLAEFEETVNVHNSKVEFATLAEMAAHIRGEMQQLMVLINDPFERDEVFLKFNKLGHDVNVAREQLGKLATSEEERNLIAQQDGVIELMVEKHRVINDLLLEERKDEAAAIIVDAYQNGRLHILFSSLQAMRELQKVMSEEHLASARDSLAASKRLTIAALCLVVFTSLFLAWMFIRYASRESALQGLIVKRMDDMNQRYEYLAMHDNLTDMPNRAQFFKCANKAFMRKQTSSHSLYILFLDIDGFKPVNDSLGHEAGNELLQQIALRILGVLAQTDFAARLGGDEFVVMSQGAKEDIESLAKMLVETICKPYVLSAGNVEIGTSIGIAEATQARDVDDALHQADLAMYQSKGSGGCRYTFSDDVPAENLNGSTLNSHLRTDR